MDVNRESLRSTFDHAAEAYDEQRRRLIPCYDDFYRILAELAQADTEDPSILDLGAGTGLLSSRLLQRYPRARLTLIDLSEKMLDTARSRFGEHPGIRYVCQDYTGYTEPGSYDLVVSALSIHHLSDPEKQALYRNAYASLKAGGIFINADQVLGGTSALDSLYKEDWKRKVEASGLAQEEIQAAYERTKLDRMAPLDAQLQWLREASFTDADCIYKYYNFVVMFGRKPAD